MHSPIVILLTFALAIGVLSSAEQDLGEHSLRLAVEARNAYLLEQVSAHHISKYVAEQRKLQEEDDDEEEEDIDGNDNEDVDSIDDEEEEIDGDDDEDVDSNDDDEEEEIHDEEPLRRQLRLRK